MSTFLWQNGSRGQLGGIASPVRIGRAGVAA
jgi:hypothetical protein